MSEAALPELAAVPWRAPARPTARCARRARLWTLDDGRPRRAVLRGRGRACSLIEPYSAPVALIALAQAWIIPGLYAVRGANTVMPRGARQRATPSRSPRACSATCSATTRASSSARPAWRSSAARSGVWLVGERGALLVVPGGRRRPLLLRDGQRRARCRRRDRIAHLLLALRTDEQGFATVANHAFAGAPWRVRRRLTAACAPGARDGGGTPRRARVRLDSGHGLERRHRGRRLRRLLRRAPARADPAPAERARHARLATSTSCSTRRCCRARRPARSSRATSSSRCARSSTAPTSGSAASRAPTRRAHASSATRRGDGRSEAVRYDQLILAARLGLARAERCPGWPSTGSASRRSPRRSRCATARCRTSRSPSRSTTRGARAST